MLKTFTIKLGISLQRHLLPLFNINLEVLANATNYEAKKKCSYGKKDNG